MSEPNRAAAGAPARPRVSVVVPVYNPGAMLRRCIDSIVGQSLPTDQFEAIFVDDGSTDTSPAMLDEAAAQHPNVTVIHQPNSGWPGKPRNVGIDASRGEYVFFMDHDDRLAPEALERMCAMADRNRSDVVVVKIVGHGRRAPREIFRRNRDKVTIRSAPLTNSLTPQKLFRRSFLDANGLRYPEGRRRLEDHHFVMRAYFAARTISILGDYTCYYHHAVEGGSAASSRYDPAGDFDPAYYFGFLGEILQIIEDNTKPGAFRDRLQVRFVRGELLGRLGGATFGRKYLLGDDDFRAAMLREVSALIERYVAPSVDPLLAPHARVQMALVRSGVPDRAELLRRMAEFERDVAATATVTRLRSTPDGRLDLAASAELTLHGSPLVFERLGADLLLPVPDGVERAVPSASRRLAGPAATGPIGALRAIRRRFRAGQGLLVLKIDEGTEAVFKPRSSVEVLEEPTSGERQRLRLTATIGPELVAGEAQRSGRWRLLVRPELAGYSVTAALTRPASAAEPTLPSGLRGLEASWAGPDGRLEVTIAPQPSGGSGSGRGAPQGGVAGRAVRRLRRAVRRIVRR